MLRILAITAPSTALSRSASSNTRNGALPPSSMEVRSSWSAASRTSARPTSVEPVNESLRRRASLISGAVSAPALLAVRTDRTPAGRPASSKIWASAYIDSGVCFAGLTIIVQPAAMAGPILRVPMASGKFHGVMNKQGPTGCFSTIRWESPDGLRPNRPSTRTASSANQRKNSDAYATSPRDSDSGLPISRVISSARSSTLACISSNARRRISPRSRGAVRAHACWLSCAMASACRPWSAVASATDAMISPVDGSSTSTVPPFAPGVHCPPRKRSVRTASRTRFSSVRLAIGTPLSSWWSHRSAVRGGSAGRDPDRLALTVA